MFCSFAVLHFLKFSSVGSTNSTTALSAFGVDFFHFFYPVCRMTHPSYFSSLFTLHIWRKSRYCAINSRQISFSSTLLEVTTRISNSNQTLEEKIELQLNTTRSWNTVVHDQTAEVLRNKLRAVVQQLHHQIVWLCVSPLTNYNAREAVRKWTVDLAIMA